MEKKRDVIDINSYRMSRRRAGIARGVMIFVLWLVCLLAGYFLATSSLFAIRHVEISGNSQVTEERIMDLAGITPGANIFSVRPSRADLWLTIEPYIASADVSRRLPGTVTVTVTERVPAAMMYAGSAVLFLDAGGRVLERFHILSEAGLPLISGVDLTGCGTVPGCVIDGAGMSEALTVLAALPADAQSIGEINVANTQNIRLYTLDGVEIRLGDASDFDTKYRLYTGVIEDDRQEGRGRIDYIDVSIVSKPTVKYR